VNEIDYSMYEHAKVTLARNGKPFFTAPAEISGDRVVFNV
jgi:hypothetical protein